MPARGTHTEPMPTAEQLRLDTLVLEVYGSVPPRTQVWKPRPYHPCDGCGTRTRRRTLCRDCADLIR